MSDLEIVEIMSSTMLIAYTIMAAAYWQDAARWADYSRSLPESTKKKSAYKFAKSAEFLFKCSTCNIIFLVCCLVAALYLNIPFLNKIINSN